MSSQLLMKCIRWLARIGLVADDALYGFLLLAAFEGGTSKIGRLPLGDKCFDVGFNVRAVDNTDVCGGNAATAVNKVGNRQCID